MILLPLAIVLHTIYAVPYCHEITNDNPESLIIPGSGCNVLDCYYYGGATTCCNESGPFTNVCMCIHGKPFKDELGWWCPGPENRSCQKDDGYHLSYTHGTCSVYPCYKFRGKTTCDHRRCVCQPGYYSGDESMCYQCPPSNVPVTRSSTPVYLVWHPLAYPLASKIHWAVHWFLNIGPMKNSNGKLFGGGWKKWNHINSDYKQKDFYSNGYNSDQQFLISNSNGGPEAFLGRKLYTYCKRDWASHIYKTGNKNAMSMGWAKLGDYKANLNDTTDAFMKFFQDVYKSEKMADNGKNTAATQNNPDAKGECWQATNTNYFPSASFYSTNADSLINWGLHNCQFMPWLAYKHFRPLMWDKEFPLPVETSDPAHYCPIDESPYKFNCGSKADNYHKEGTIADLKTVQNDTSEVYL